MRGPLNHYRTAFALSIAAALINCLLWAVVLSHRPEAHSSMITVSAISILIPFGLWVQSGFARVAGAVFLLIIAGSLIWPLVSSGVAMLIRLPSLTVLYIFAALFNLVTAGVLLFSRKFRVEFVFEREHQPKYKRYVKWSLGIAIIAGMIIATLIDIIRIA